VPENGRASRRRDAGREPRALDPATRAPDLAGVGRGFALLLVARESSRLVVARRCATAARAGVSIGSSLAEARAAVGAHPTKVLPYRAEAERAALRSLASWAHRWAPVVAPDPPDGLLLEIGGCERLFGSEEAHARGLLAAVRRLGFTARLGVASTVGCAWAAVRHTAGGGAPDPVHVPPGAERAALAPMPVSALRVDAPVAEALFDVGVERVGDLEPLPRDELATRYGVELLRRLDQATGVADEAVEAHRPRPPSAVERTFDGPVSDGEVLRAALRELIGELVAALETADVGALRVRVELHRFDGGAVSADVELSVPRRDERHLRALLEPRLERLDPGFGAERLRLEAVRVRRVRLRASSWFGVAPEDDDAFDLAFGDLLDVLAGRCGGDRLVRFAPVESHVPERAFEARRVAEDRALGVGDVASVERADGTRGGGAPAVTPCDRPSLLYDVPEPVEVVSSVPDGPPASLRRPHGEVRRVVRAIGPERIAEPWWTRARPRALAPAGPRAVLPAGPREDASAHAGDAAAPDPAEVHPAGARDYFRVEDDTGRWLWVYRAHDADRWFVHGEWA
jgi:protein ImuB